MVGPGQVVVVKHQGVETLARKGGGQGGPVRARSLDPGHGRGEGLEQGRALRSCKESAGGAADADDAYQGQ